MGGAGNEKSEVRCCAGEGNVSNGDDWWVYSMGWVCLAVIFNYNFFMPRDIKEWYIIFSLAM